MAILNYFRLPVVVAGSIEKWVTKHWPGFGLKLVFRVDLSSRFFMTIF